MRAGMSPLEPIPIGRAVWNNAFGENSGNLIYQYSVFRALMREDTEFVARDFTSVYDAPGGVERLNETCDCAVFTLANAFRVDAIPTLVFMKDGKAVGQAVGLQGKDALKAMIEKVKGA